MQKKLGFTLIELLLVVLIIGSLAAVAVPQYQLAVQKTKFMSMVPYVEHMVRQQDIYFMETGSYAQNFEEIPDLIPAGYIFMSSSKSWIGNYSSTPPKFLALNKDGVYAEPFGQGACQYSHTYTAKGGAKKCRTREGVCDRLCVSIGGVNPRSTGGGWTTFDLP